MRTKKNNKIILLKDGKERRLFWVNGLKVKFYGSNNKIVFCNKVPKLKNVVIHVGDSTNIVIKESEYRIKNLYINARAKRVGVNIGEDFSIESGRFDFHGEGDCSINIGNDCQFGCNITLDTADGHTIYDMETKEILNHQQDINIKSHVWLCENVSVLKGAEIPENCVVGKNSTVTSRFKKPNSILAGTPAKRVEREKYSNVNWSRSAVKYFKAD